MRWAAQRQPTYTPSFAQQAHDLKSVVALRGNTRHAGLRRTIAARHCSDRSGRAPHLTLAAARGIWPMVGRAASGAHHPRRSSAVTMTLAAKGHVDVAAAERLDACAIALVTAVDRLTSLVQWRSDLHAALASLPLAEVEARASGLVSNSHRAARWGAFVAATQEARETVCRAAGGSGGSGSREPRGPAARAATRVLVRVAGQMRRGPAGVGPLPCPHPRATRPGIPGPGSTRAGPTTACDWSHRCAHGYRHHFGTKPLRR